MRARHLVLSALAAAAVAFAAVPAVQAAAAPGSPGKAKAAAAKSGKSAVKKAKPAKPAPFSVNGTVTAVDATARTVTLAATGGMKDLRNTSVTITIAADAKIVVDDVRAPLAEVTAGDRATIVGLRTGGTLTAKKISATSPEPTETPSETPSESPSESPTPTETPTV